MICLVVCILHTARNYCKILFIIQLSILGQWAMSVWSWCRHLRDCFISIWGLCDGSCVCTLFWGADILWNVGHQLHIDMAHHPKWLNCILWLWKRQSYIFAILEVTINCKMWPSKIIIWTVNSQSEEWYYLWDFKQIQFSITQVISLCEMYRE